MKFTRLRLLGFKSFVEPADFLIEAGLTGVVGPNGCGKSNLVEALRWVMGESSHKSLRAADMDDVIFSGTNNRPGRNNAEVAIQIDNNARKAPAQFNEHATLDVSRRIERDAGSTYRINGREVRARDVQILFADASTGSRSPSMVHQGRIGEIIQAKPEQRRRVLEEAAGISGLHARRHEAELRLRAAEHNLARLDDVINQLVSQIDALKRQARQAIRYRAVAQQVRKAEATLFHLRWTVATAELAEAERAKDLAVRVVAERTGEQAEASKRQALAAAALPERREAQARAAAALQRLVMARETFQREEERAKERMAELDRRLVQLDDDFVREQRLAADAEAVLARLAAEEDTLANEAKANQVQREGIEGRVTEADAALARSERRSDELTGKLADLTARRHALDSAMREHADRIFRLSGEMAAIEAELNGLGTQDAQDADLTALVQATERSQTAVAKSEAAAVRAEAAHSAARQSLEAVRGPLAQAERRAQGLETEAKTLARLLHLDAKKLWPAVIDTLEVEKGYEAALGAALGDDLEAPVDRSAPMHWAGAAVDPADPALPEAVEALGSRAKAPPELARRLAQIGVIAREDAARLVPMLRPGQRLVSRDGDLWRWDGFSVAANAPTGAGRRLAGKNRLGDIETELEALRRELEVKRKAVTTAEAEVASAAAEETATRTRCRALQQEALAARDRHAEAERAASRHAARLSALTEAKARLTTSRDETAAARTEAEEAIASLPAGADIEAQLTALRSEIEAQRARVAEVRAEAQALAREAEISARRLTVIAADRQAWSERRDGAVAQITSLEARLDEAKKERAELEDAPRIFEEKRRALIGEIEAAEAERRAAADHLAEGENALAEADRDARSALEAMASAREDAARAHERFEGGKRRLADVAHEIHETLEVEPASRQAVAGGERGRSQSRTLAARSRAPRRRQPPCRGRIARSRDAAWIPQRRTR